MKLKNYLIMIVVLTFVFLAACSAGSDEASGSGDGEKEISFIHWRGEDKEVFDELITKFEEENPDITVEMTIYPSEQYQSTAQTQIRDGEVGDVFTSFPGAQFKIMDKAGLMEDLSGEGFLDNFNKDLIEAGQKDGKQFAVPYQLVFNQPVYNKGLFEELGIEPPNDWEGFLAMNEKLKENGYTPIAFPGADIGAGQLMNSMMMNNAPDEEIFTKLENGETKLTDEWWVKTLTQFKELADKDYFQKDSLGTKHDGAIALMAQEKAGMLASGSYAMASIKEQNPDMELGLLAPITVSADEAEYEGIHTTTFMLAVNSNSDSKPEAKKFIEFLSQKENAEKYANETGQHLTVNDLEYESEELKSTAHWMEKNTRFHPRYLISSADIQKAVEASIQAVIGGQDPEQAAKEAQQVVDQFVE
ncbi:sugar ABC transporter substrate-binding protein [Thalassobacillus devorans]|uniref:Sugar ABC transporter substrate-binding protein n=1 Tax=Thalassobacillus devorans TaxID=279813 RepID=A0ABQ1NUC2_9BACI|nr:extracellular solute-binding protein [Thalassobacillus devorans]NIK28553.1 raffinose/stachyose/melibiose transport system substrate-binding protein [Thalassobacillus devorans]GGC85327.1 sugar ABC transporter substrate-binding protein [Thalassobacillus devorans]